MKFSIITISYNAEKSIGKTIESVLAQNCKDFEYIFIDGGSQDTTNSIIKTYCKEMERLGIRYKHISEPDKGISDAFSKGVKLAQGEVIAILNAGDQMLENTLDYLDENFCDDIDVFYGNIIWNDEKRNIKYIKKSKPPQFLDELKYKMVIKHPATYIRKDAYVRYGVYDLSYRYAMDTELLLRMYMNGARFQYVDKEFTLFEAGGVSDSNIRAVLKEVERIALDAGESYLVVRIKMIIRFLYHHMAHFVRYNLKK